MDSLPAEPQGKPAIRCKHSFICTGKPKNLQDDLEPNPEQLTCACIKPRSVCPLRFDFLPLVAWRWCLRWTWSRCPGPSQPVAHPGLRRAGLEQAFFQKEDTACRVAFLWENDMSEHYQKSQLHNCPGIQLSRSGDCQTLSPPAFPLPSCLACLSKPKLKWFVSWLACRSALGLPLGLSVNLLTGRSQVGSLTRVGQACWNKGGTDKCRRLFNLRGSNAWTNPKHADTGQHKAKSDLRWTLAF